MGEPLQDFLNRIRLELDSLVEQARVYRPEKGGREVATTITKLQEARLWAGEALKEAGFVQPYTPIQNTEATE